MIPLKKEFHYTVINFDGIMNLGKSFLADVDIDSKSFAVGSTGYLHNQQKAILAIASFFDRYVEKKTVIISANLYDSQFKNFINVSNKNKMSEVDIDIFSFYNHFDFIDLNSILQLAERLTLAEYYSLIQKIEDQYEVLLWDVPEIQVISKNINIYLPIVQTFDSFTVITNYSKSRQNPISDIRIFFENHGINIRELNFSFADEVVEKNAREKKSRLLKKILSL